MTAPKTFFSLLLKALLSVLLAGCCANNRCDCADERADALYLKFQVAADGMPASTTLFSPAEVGTVYVLRYARTLAMTPRNPHDSVALIRNQLQVGNPVIINTRTPFAAVSGQRLNGFNYLVFVRLANHKRKTFEISNIVLQGSMEGDGCCTCYRNHRKTATVTDSITTTTTTTVRDSIYNVTETGQQPVDIPLFKH